MIILYHVRHACKLSSNHKGLSLRLVFDYVLNDCVKLFFSFITNSSVNLATTNKLHAAELLSDYSKLYLQVCKKQPFHIWVTIQLLQWWNDLTSEKNQPVWTICWWFWKQCKKLSELVILEVWIAATHSSWKFKPFIHVVIQNPTSNCACSIHSKQRCASHALSKECIWREEHVHSLTHQVVSWRRYLFDWRYVESMQVKPFSWNIELKIDG